MPAATHFSFQNRLAGRPGDSDIPPGAKESMRFVYKMAFRKGLDLRALCWKIGFGDIEVRYTGK